MRPTEFLDFSRVLNHLSALKYHFSKAFHAVDADNSFLTKALIKKYYFRRTFYSYF